MRKKSCQQWTKRDGSGRDQARPGSMSALLAAGGRQALKPVLDADRKRTPFCIRLAARQPPASTIAGE